MKKLKITDGKIKNIERKLLKYLKSEYSQADGMLYVRVDNVNITNIDGIFADIHITYGLSESESKNWQASVNFPLISMNLNFIAGQFAHSIFVLENYRVDGIK